MPNDPFLQVRLGPLELGNRFIMAPMTRNRPLGNVPQDFAATCCGQRTEAVLILPGGAFPSPSVLGCARIPGLFRAEHIKGWHQVTETVHQRRGRIFAQVMPLGRIGPPSSLPKGTEGPSPAVEAAGGDLWTDWSRS